MLLLVRVANPVELVYSCIYDNVCSCFPQLQIVTTWIILARRTVFIKRKSLLIKLITELKFKYRVLMID